MKKAISLFLSLIMVFGIFTSFPSVKVQAGAAEDDALEATDIFTVETDWAVDGKVNCTVYLNAGIKMSGAIIYAKFDENVLAIDRENTGAYMVDDGDGGERENISGMYVADYMENSSNQFSIAHIYSENADYNVGSSNKPYIKFAFDVIDENRPVTSVEFYCYEFFSASETVNNIPNGSTELVYSKTETTLGQVEIIGAVNKANGIEISWEKEIGADSYVVYKEQDGVNVELATIDGSATSYIDTDVKNNKTFRYAVRAINEGSEAGYFAPLSDTVQTKYMSAPENIELSNGDGKVVVTWSAVEGATAYRVYRRSVNADGTTSDWAYLSSKIDSLTYSDKTVENEQAYEYAIRVYADDVYSDLYAEKGITFVTVGHAFGEWTVKTEPTCTQEGTRIKPCLTCDAVETEAIPALGHDYSTEWVIDKEATCDEKGSKSNHCSRCDSITNVTEIEATGHDFAEKWVVDAVATCTSDGMKSRHCSKCDAKTDVEVIKATGHKAGSWETTKKATVNAAGKKVKKCTVCDATVETATIKQLLCSKPKLKEIANTEYGVKITWSKTSGADKYRVYRKTSKSSWKYIGDTTKTYYTDKTAKSGTKYYYAVKARNEAGNSDYSSSLSKYYLADTILSTPKSTKSGITLKWKKVTGADGYMVYRKTGSGSYSKIATVKGNSKVTYTDKTAKKGKTYTYKVKAYKSKTYSAYSNAKKIKDKY